MTVNPIHFLLVEDDDAHAELITMAMEENRIFNTIDRVSDGEQALAYLRRKGEYAGCPRPDVIILDLKLPRIDGHEVLAAIKNDDEFLTIPVVVMTTSATEVDRARAYGNHANSYLIKPLDFDKFHQMIRDLKIYWAAWNQAPVPAPA